MSAEWERSPAARKLRAAGRLEVEAPPPLALVRQEAGRRARRTATVLAFAVAVPLGAAATAGGYAWTQKPSQEPSVPRRGEGRGPVEARKVVEAPKLEEAEEVAPLEAEAVATLPAEAPRASPRPLVARQVPRAPTAPLTPALSPAAERERSPDTPAISGVAAAPAAPLRTSLADESRALAEALAALRVQRDAPRALELLAAYRARFPAGALKHEAALATVEAHRVLGHVSEALAALDEAPARADLTVLRGELLAQLGRCDEARAVLAGLSPSGALRERALFTQATCALTLGERGEAARLLEQLPDSTRAAELLEKLR